MKASRLIVAAVLSAGAIMATSAQASLVVMDNFNGTAGASLQDHVGEVGGKNWIVDGGAVPVFTSTGAVTTGEHAAAQAAIYLGGANSNPWDYSIVANVKVGTAEFVSIGFANANTGLDWNNLSQPSVRILANGNYDFYGIGGGTIPGFDASAFNKIELRYLVGNPGIKLYVNDVQIADNWIGWKGWVNTDYTSAGFRINNGSGGGAAIDYFAVGANPVDLQIVEVPEPASLGLMSIAAVGLLVKRRR